MAKQSIKKLSREEIRQGLDQIPVDILLSSGPGKRADLTTKQREFARAIAMGKTKASAYRESYKQDATKATIRTAPYELAANPAISREVAAYTLAIEAEKHRTPGQLKALLVQQLVQHSLDDDFPPAQRVQCLRLLGQLFEVGAFVERKEITTINRSGDIRARLLATLSQVTDITPIDADQAAQQLLDEIHQGAAGSQAAAGAYSEVGPAAPTGGVPPPAAVPAPVCATHTIPDIGGPTNLDVVSDFDR
jgi:hypothetical protein